MSSRKCDKFKNDVHKASCANPLKKQLENIKQIELILQEWLFREPFKSLKENIQSQTFTGHSKIRY